MESHELSLDSSKSNIPHTEHHEPAYWSGVFSITLCIFALIASEFMPVSLLTPMADDLGVSTGKVGQGIAISGFFAVITSLYSSVLFAKSDRKKVLIGLTFLMLISALIIGFATNYLIYMIGRSLIGIVIGGFWSLSAACAMKLVPAVKVPKALAIFNGGNALAMIIAAPLGSYLGGIVGWRGAFLMLVPVSLIALLWQWISLPKMPASNQKVRFLETFKTLKSPLVHRGMLAVGIFFVGQFTLFTYIRPYLEIALNADPTMISLILLGLGIAGFIGTAFVSAFIKWNLYRTLILIPLIMAGLAFGLVLLNSNVMLVIALLLSWGMVATAAPVAWWSWIAQSMPDKAEIGGGLMVAVIQLSIAFGSTLGGELFDLSGYSSSFFASATLLLFAAALAWLTARVKN